MAVYVDLLPSTLAQKTVHYLPGPSTFAHGHFGRKNCHFASKNGHYGGNNSHFIALTVILAGKRSFCKTYGSIV